MGRVVRSKADYGVMIFADQALISPVDGLDPRARSDLDLRFLVIGLWFQPEPVVRKLARKIGFGQWRALIGRVGLVADEQD